MKYKIGFLLLLTAFVAGLYFISDMVRITQIDISGNIHNSQEEILEIVGFTREATVLDTIKHRPKIIENKGYIARIEITYPTITTIKIEVIEKERMGYVKYMSSYLCLDANAYIIDNVKTPDANVARIEGLNIKSFALNESLEIEDDIKLALLNIYKLLKAYDLSARVIDLNYKKAENISLDFGKIKVNIGNSRRLEEKFSLMKEILSTIEPEKEGVLHLENPDKKIIFKHSIKPEETEAKEVDKTQEDKTEE
ncbi:hypothetical protein EII17_01255 [Clostridiales bacterium COT073_COT-073]|nr:hypothetical protein EII17_01255 [Clostridiales bacterium COT073_COT-073]